MNNRILRTFLCGACLMGCAVVPFLAPAQTLRTSYFLESMPMRHRLNPALVSDRGYISIPAIGNINVATQSNVGLTAFLYPLPDGRQVDTLQLAFECKGTGGELPFLYDRTQCGGYHRSRRTVGQPRQDR